MTDPFTWLDSIPLPPTVVFWFAVGFLALLLLIGIATRDWDE